MHYKCKPYTMYMHTPTDTLMFATCRMFWHKRPFFSIILLIVKGKIIKTVNKKCNSKENSKVDTVSTAMPLQVGVHPATRGSLVGSPFWTPLSLCLWAKHFTCPACWWRNIAASPQSSSPMAVYNLHQLPIYNSSYTWYILQCTAHIYIQYYLCFHIRKNILL